MVDASRSGLSPLPGWRPEWTKAKGAWPVDLAQDPLLRQTFDVLRSKWTEVPFTMLERVKTAELAKVSDERLAALWNTAFVARSPIDESGWVYLLYRDAFKGKKILDVGSGLGLDSIHYAKHGARVTFLDIAQSNLQVVERMCRINGVDDASFCYLEDLSSLDRLPTDFDYFYAEGSLINAPLEVTKMEIAALLQHLPIGGRVVGLGYPRIRWEREGGLAETQWGSETDGGAPWMEWFDLEKLRWLFAPATFDVVLYFEFHNADFIWYDLVRTS